MKKKILVVDDTPANLEAAKAYFANNTDFEFVYATNRKETEELLPSCDALITDRQMPYVTGETMDQYDFGKEDRTQGQWENLLKSNGLALLAEASALEKPAVMISNHGSYTILFVSKNIQMAKIFAEKFKSTNPYTLEVTHPYIGGYFSEGLESKSFENLSKEDPRAWELAFAKLSEEFKLNEKPTEIQKIKLQ